ncbi:Mitochondrial substrate carrier family protein [Forsythia ovata]|uniref:Mitochondrial substrate carrier family protein n=1 Tax=Forsythia ovata TaxID=205694 RepID=A0ABD1UD89_9LAMI
MALSMMDLLQLKGPLSWLQAGGGIFAGATASCITTPLDTIKTRLQVTGLEIRPTARQVVKNLMAEDGWAGLYRGLGPRFFSMSAWGTTMIVAYEYLKRLCAKDE